MVVGWPLVYRTPGGAGDYGGRLALFTAPRVGRGIMVVGWHLVYCNPGGAGDYGGRLLFTLRRVGREIMVVSWPLVHLKAGGAGEYGGRLASCLPHPGWGGGLWWSAGLLFTAPRVGRGIMVVGWPLV